VYLGEYAAHEPDRKNTLRSALAEAAYMTTLERNGDVVRFASYAPLLARQGHTQWNPNLIYFTGTAVCPTVNYYVQQMFSVNHGDVSLPVTSELPASCVKHAKTGDIILKLVNVTASATRVPVELAGSVKPSATRTILAGDPDALDTLPVTSDFTVGNSFAYDAPAHSITVIRMKTK
jgi:alpha-L-arabinofuranosidase